MLLHFINTASADTAPRNRGQANRARSASTSKSQAPARPQNQPALNQREDRGMIANYEEWATLNQEEIRKSWSQNRNMNAYFQGGFAKKGNREEKRKK